MAAEAKAWIDVQRGAEPRGLGLEPRQGEAKVPRWGICLPLHPVVRYFFFLTYLTKIDKYFLRQNKHET